MNGHCRFPGLVRDEPCTITIRKPPAGAEYVGPDLPGELFDRPWDGQVLGAPGTRTESGYAVTARLTDHNLESNLESNLALRRFYGTVPVRPFPYEVVPKHFLNGWTRLNELRIGAECYIWIKPPGEIPWLEREPDRLPPEFPSYPRDHLVGFWQAKVMAILKPKEDVPLRKLRAILVDPRIRTHRNSRVRELYGHEPWEDYLVTETDNELVEAGSEAISDLGSAATRLLGRLPDWMKDTSGSVWATD